jgi:hypothetical protein
LRPLLRPVLLCLILLAFPLLSEDDDRFSTITTSLDESLPRAAFLDDYFYPGLIELPGEAPEDPADEEEDEEEEEDESDDYEMEESEEDEEEDSEGDEAEDAAEAEQQYATPVRVHSLPVDPGYYRIRLSSFCLQSGKYRPADGDGYLLAPLKGPRAEIITNILVRLKDHEKIDQEYVQSFLWAVENDVAYGEIDEEVLAVVDPLLTTEERQSLRVPIQPQERAMKARRAAVLRWMGKRAVRERGPAARSSHRDRFKQLEQALVPIRPDKPQTSVPAGAWTALGQGTYVRFFPDGYSEVEVEIYRPGPRSVRLSRDPIGRISRMEDAGSVTDISYRNDGEDIQLGAETVRVHRFKEIRYTDKKTGQSASATIDGYIFDSAPFYNIVFGTNERRASRPRGLLDNFIPDEVKADYNRAKDHASKARALYKEYEKTHGNPPPPDAMKDLLDVERYKKGLETAKNPLDFGGRTEWARNHAKTLADAFAQAHGILGGGDDGAKRPPGLPGKAAMPGASGSQRLGLSGRAR